MTYAMLIDPDSAPLPGSDAWTALCEDEHKQIYADYGAIIGRPRLMSGVPLDFPGDATTIRVPNAKPLTTDGPFMGMKEAVAGYFVLDADNLDAAVALPARVPTARLGGAVEIRSSETLW